MPLTSQAKIESKIDAGIKHAKFNSMFCERTVPVSLRLCFCANSGKDVSEMAVVNEITTAVILFGLAEK